MKIYSPIYTIEDADTSYINKLVFGNKGVLKVMPAAVYSAIPSAHRALFCHQNAIYGLPTCELISWITDLPFFHAESAIEVGAGSGTLGRALGIKMTDSKLQNIPKIKNLYKAINQPVINYPKDVIKLTAKRAIMKYKPDVVIAQWVTHRYIPTQDKTDSGLFWGVDEMELLKSVKYYIFIGNMQTHKDKPIMSMSHKTYHFDWLYSRSIYSEDNFISIWEGGKK